MNNIIKDVTVELLKKYEVKFDEYFKKEVDLLKSFIDDGMVVLTKRLMKVTSLGKMFIRHICKVFDKYVRNKIYEVSGP